MRELIYLSQRKLSQFQIDETRRSKRRRVRDFGVTAPLGMGGVQFGLTDKAEAGPVSLDVALAHLEPDGKPLKSIFDPSVQAGDWVRFAAKLTYHVFCDYKPGFEPREDFHLLDSRMRSQLWPQLGDRTALTFWNPVQEMPIVEEPPNICRVASEPTRLLLHGNPAHLVGTSPPGNSDWPESLVRWGASHPTFLFDLLRNGPGPIYRGEGRGGYFDGFAGHLHRALQTLDDSYPPELAFSQAGIALVSVVIDRPPKSVKLTELPATPRERVVRIEHPAWRAVVASPLYVERTNGQAV